MGIIDETWFVRPEGVEVRMAAGGVVTRVEDGQILIAFAHEAKFETCVLPKGGIDPWEDAVEAAEREIEEEAGVRGLKLLGELGVCERLNFKKTKWSVVQYFLFLTEDEGGQPTDEKKHPQPAVWYGLDDLPELFWPEQGKLLEEKRGEIERLVREAVE